MLRRLKAVLLSMPGRLASRCTGPAPDDRHLDDVLNLIERNARLESEMISELREASRVGSPLLYRSSLVDLAELVRSTTDALRPMARERRIKLSARCAATSVIVAADAQDLTHIVGRLVASAVTFSSRGDSVECVLELDGDWVRLIVGARGAHPESYARAAGDPAFPPDFGAAKWEELGLGTVLDLIERLGGIVRLQAEADHPAPIFTVILPGDPAIPVEERDG